MCSSLALQVVLLGIALQVLCMHACGSDTNTRRNQQRACFLQLEGQLGSVYNTACMQSLVPLFNNIEMM